MKIICALAFVCVLNSCAIDPCGNSKTAFLDRYESFIDDVEKKDLQFSDKSWDEIDERFKGFIKECYPEHEDDLTRREEREFTENTAKYYYIKYGEGLYQHFKENEEEYVEILGDHLELFAEELSEFIDDHDEEISELIAHLKENLDEEKINETLDNISAFFENLDVDIQIKSRD